MRQPIKPRPFLLRDERVRDTLIAAIRNLPLDAAKPLEVVIREPVKVRKLDQQALLFAGPMRDLAEQAFIEGRQFSIDIWHDFCKKEFLPEEFDSQLCLESYRKWDIAPDDTRVLIGSTKQLTVYGYSQYLEQVFAFGANLGVRFHTNPKE